MIDLAGQRILLTGAAGGIGQQLTERLAAAGARMVLLDRTIEPLQDLLRSLDPAGERLTAVGVDLLDDDARTQAVDLAEKQLGAIDVLINNAGLLSFRPFAQEDPQVIDRIMRLNCLVPMRLARQVLPGMLSASRGRILNIGSTFGSIGFAWFSSYSASKFGLRGFSQALRRELAGSGVGVSYVAPRAVKTKLNTGAIYRMAEATGMRMDDPEWVAERIVEALRRERDEVYLGFPESLFARINALLPGLVDRAVRRQGADMKPFAEGETA